MGVENSEHDLAQESQPPSKGYAPGTEPPQPQTPTAPTSMPNPIPPAPGSGPDQFASPGFTGTRDWWNKRTRAARIGIIGGGVVVLLLIVGAIAGNSAAISGKSTNDACAVVRHAVEDSPTDASGGIDTTADQTALDDLKGLKAKNSKLNKDISNLRSAYQNEIRMADSNSIPSTIDAIQRTTDALSALDDYCS